MISWARVPIEKELAWTIFLGGCLWAQARIDDHGQLICWELGH